MFLKTQCKILVISVAVGWRIIGGSPSGPRDFVMSSFVIIWFKYVSEILKLLNIVFSHLMSLRLKLDLGEKKQSENNHSRTSFFIWLWKQLCRPRS